MDNINNFLDKLEFKSSGETVNSLTRTNNALGNFFLTPARYLLNGKTVTLVKIEENYTPKETYEIGKNVEDTPRMKMIKTIAALVLFAPGVILGTVIKLPTILMSSNLREIYKGHKRLIEAENLFIKIHKLIVEGNISELEPILKTLKESSRSSRSEKMKSTNFDLVIKNSSLSDDDKRAWNNFFRNISFDSIEEAIKTIKDEIPDFENNKNYENVLAGKIIKFTKSRLFYSS